MNKLSIFSNEQFRQLRSAVIKDEPWFIVVNTYISLELSETGKVTEYIAPN